MVVTPGESGLDLPTDVLGDRAAWMEAATLGKLGDLRRFALEGRLSEHLALAHTRRRRQQRPRVGMPGIGEYRTCGAGLDDAAEVHDQHALADVTDDREIVRDADQRQPKLPTEIREQVEDRRLHRGVERRDGLVRDEDLRFERERSRDPDALSLPSGQSAGERVSAERGR
jgi:hypothetical protein